MEAGAKAIAIEKEKQGSLNPRRVVLLRILTPRDESANPSACAVADSNFGVNS